MIKKSYCFRRISVPEELDRTFQNNTLQTALRETASLLETEAKELRSLADLAEQDKIRLMNIITHDQHDSKIIFSANPKDVKKWVNDLVLTELGKTF
jgi:hypothetical protein